jgi:hypothetical protein
MCVDPIITDRFVSSLIFLNSTISLAVIPPMQNTIIRGLLDWEVGAEDPLGLITSQEDVFAI